VGWLEWTARTRQIEPSIYAADFARLGEQLDDLLAAGARIFHFDVGDGHFVSEITIGPVVLRAISERVHAGGGVLDCHLMVSDPVSQLERIKDAGGDSVTFHVEVADAPADVAARARELGLGVGVAFNPETAIAQAAAGIAEAEADLALCMSIHPGLSGQKLMPEALGRIEELRSLVPDTTLVQVDGGISPENAAAVSGAGADLLVAGSAVFWHGRPGVAYRALVDTVEAVAA
jgi:ribulose-phosphate 3-epimerase